MSYKFLLTRRDGPVERLTVNRPDVRNAFNAEMIAEICAWAVDFHREPRGARAVVLAGAGKAFCAGADAKWLATVAAHSEEENVRDSTITSQMFRDLDRLPVPLIGRIHGAAIGGGSGLAAVCDIVVAADDAVFGFTEVKLGVIPSVISPFVLAKIGLSAARELFLTGARFPAARAYKMELVHAVVPAADLPAQTERFAAQITRAPRDVLMRTKAKATRRSRVTAGTTLDL